MEKLKDSWEQWRAELNAYLRNYRSTPHPSIGVNLYSLVFKTNSPTLDAVFVRKKY